MKKTLLAVAVAAALPAAAFAQVTLYGVADISIAKATGVDAQMNANGAGNNGNSRLGVKGSEDLGGGLKASFNYEMAVNPENGATDSNTYQRAAWMQLDGGFGSLRMGRSLSPSFYGVAAWELTGTANYSAQYNTFGAAGGATRNNSAFAYTTPNFSGFTATLGYITSGDNGGSSKIDANAIYSAGPLVVALSYNKVEDSGDAGWALGGRYNFGMGVVAASVVDQGDQGAGLKGFTLGGGTKLGPVDVVLDIARVTTSGAKSTNWLLEGKYPLSKRTFAYATYRKMDLADVSVSSFGIRHNF